MIPSPSSRPLFLLVVLFPPLGVIAPKSLAPLLFVAALWQFVPACINGRWRGIFKGPVAIMAGLIAIWALTSVLWSLDALAGLLTAAKLTGVLLAMLIVLDGARSIKAGDRKLFNKALMVSYVIASALIGFETLFGAAGHNWVAWLSRRAEYDLTVLNRAGVILFLAAWPVALVLWRQRRRLLALLAVLAAAAVIYFGVSSSNLIALFAGLTGALLAWFLGPRLQYVLALIFAAGILVAPITTATWLTPERMAPHVDGAYYSVLHRIHIWHFTGERIAEKPVLGWGIDAARRIPGGDTKLPGGGNVMSVHPHNASLQIWLELGGLGALLAAILVIALWRTVGALTDPAARAAATAMLLSALIVANLSFGIWQTWWMATLTVGAVLWTVALQVSSK